LRRALTAVNLQMMVERVSYRTAQKLRDSGFPQNNTWYHIGKPSGVPYRWKNRKEPTNDPVCPSAGHISREIERRWPGIGQDLMLSLIDKVVEELAELYILLATTVQESAKSAGA